MPNEADSDAMRERLRELEIKITFLDETVAQQNGVILELSRQIDRLTRALRSLAEKTETLEAGGGNGVPPADERPPHW